MTTGPVEIDALRYLHQPDDGFWRWTDDGGAIQWFDGATIVFTAELKAILRHQYASGSRGLPPLGAVILLVAATRENWSHALTKDVNPQRLHWLLKAAGRHSDALLQVLHELGKIALLDGDLRLNLEAKQCLAEFVFAHSVRTSVETAGEVLRLLSNAEETFWNYRHPFADQGEKSLLESINVLEGKLNAVTPQKLRLLRETGIDEIPVVPAEQELEFPEYDSIKSLVRELQSDKDLFGIARATQQLMSVMSLPRPMLQADQMEQGGFSDIANRGSLDRLLLSELAYDDLTLAVRVAVNEAMYLRREIPPSESQRRRVFLLDSGLRMWGVPRFLGTSVALALAGQLQSKTDQDAAPFTAFTANGQQLQEIDLSQRTGIVAHLKMLRPELDPGESFQALEKTLDDFPEAPEVVVITSPEALGDVKFRDGIAAMARQNPGSYFVVSVGRDGETRLNEITRSGCKPIQQLKFDLKRVFANPPISSDRPASQLPAILGLEKFPLLLSYHFKQQASVWPLGSEKMLAISRDSRLMLSDGSKKGALQLLPTIKQATHRWSSREPINSVWFSIVGSVGNNKRGQFRLLSFNQDEMSVKETDLELTEQPIAFCNHGSTIFSIGDTHVSIIDQSNGMTLPSRLSLEGKTHRWERYFTFGHRPERQVFALASDGRQPKFELLPPAPESVRKYNYRLFESTEVEGTIGIFTSWHLYFWATDQLIEIQHGLGKDLAIESICPTGNQIVLRDNVTKQKAKIDTKTGLSVKPPGNLKDFQQLQMEKLVGRKTLRTKFVSIAIHNDGSLSLTSRNQSQVDITSAGNRIFLAPNHVTGSPHSRINFARQSAAISGRFRLKVARWKDGSEAWLDSRGLLHLKSSDHEIPELTIVLTDDVMGGWISNNRVWGDSFFLPLNSPIHATSKFVMDIIGKFTSNIVSRC